jgi:hypothetical protein
MGSQVAPMHSRVSITSPSASSDSVALHPSGTAAPYTFQVTPTLATRYTVEVFRNSTATAPLASSATSRR